MEFPENLQQRLIKILEISTETPKLEDKQKPLKIQINANKPTQQKPKKVNVEKEKINIDFNLIDTEGRDMLDIYQIRKYLEQSSSDKTPLFLLEKDIKNCLNEMSLSSTYSIKRDEFELFKKYIESNEQDLRKIAQEHSLLKKYSNYYTKTTRKEPKKENSLRTILQDIQHLHG